MGGSERDDKVGKVRLRVLPRATVGDESTSLVAQMRADAATFEQRMTAEPGTSLAEEETGLSLDAIVAFERGGVSRAQLRALGRELAARGQPRTTDAYRRILDQARSLQLDDLLEALDLGALR